MAFAYAITDVREVWGGKRVVFGTFTNGGADTGGDIVTGLEAVDFFSLQSKGAAVIANAPVVNETFPLASGSVTIVTTADEDGFWMAVGK